MKASMQKCAAMHQLNRDNSCARGGFPTGYVSVVRINAQVMLALRCASAVSTLTVVRDMSSRQHSVSKHDSCTMFGCWEVS